MSARDHRQTMKKTIIPIPKATELISVPADEYAKLLGQIQDLKDRVIELEEIDAARKTGKITDRLRTSIKYKVTRFVFRVQANQSIENVVAAIDRATDDICEFIAQPEKAENKSMNSVVIHFDD